VDAAIAPYLAAARAESRRKLGVTLERPLPRVASGGSPLGTAAAQALRRAGKADFGLVNRGGVRADLPAGELTAGALYEALPFPDRTVVVTLGGREVEALARDVGERGVLAGLVLREDGRVVLCDGEALEPSRPYLVATNEYVAAGKEGARAVLGRLAPDRFEQLGVTTRDAVAAWLREAPKGRAAEACP
jgi:5'-nucleotidase